MDTWNNTIILTRAAKDHGNNRYWYNIHNETTQDNNLSVDLSRIAWKGIKVPDEASVQVVNIANIYGDATRNELAKTKAIQHL